MGAMNGARIPDEFPQQRVSDFQVYIEFVNDEDGVDFRDWLHEEGFAKFNSWREAR